MSSSGSWKVDVDKLILTPEVRRAVVDELEKRRLPVFREEARQIQFLKEIEYALESTRRRCSAQPSDRDAPGFKQIRMHLRGLQREFSKLTPWQRAEFDLAAYHEAREWLRARQEGGAEASAGEGADVPNTAAEWIFSGPKTMLARVEPISDEGTSQQFGFSSDYLLDRFEWESEIFTAAADQLIASYAELPPQHNYVGPPYAIIRLIYFVGHAWRRAFGQEPDDEPNGAFGEVVNRLISMLGIFEGKKNIGAKSLKRALKG